jgi:hypothetical protein
MFSHRPSPALVISIIALFVSLGGTGYAASQLPLGAGAAKKHKAPEKPVTAKQVEKLIAKYVSVHHLGATGPEGKAGPAGANGTNGAKGETGPQGPGAKAIDIKDTNVSSPATTVAFGPWTLHNFCGTGEDSWEVEGPGNFYDTITRGITGATATAVDENGEIASTRLEELVLTGFQSNVHMFVASGSAVGELDIEVTATHGLFESCEVVGTAIPAS